MRILVAGATGVVGRRLLPLLVGAGHEVVGMTRFEGRAALVEQLGARAVVADVLDREHVANVVGACQPEALVHLITDLSQRDFAANDLVRREGTRHLVDAALRAGTRRLVAASIAFAYAPGTAPAREDDPLDLDAPMPRRRTVAAVAALEDAARELDEPVLLRLGALYGPGTFYAADGLTALDVRLGRLVADDAVTSFLHVDDAARAMLAALAWPVGIVNVVDDEPAPASEWLPLYAALLHAPPVRRGSGRPAFARGASNRKARRELGLSLLHPSWRGGFPAELGPVSETSSAARSP